jgi:alkylation response protein AidB-like acyl-CoA dehydrogenase
MIDVRPEPTELRELCRQVLADRQPRTLFDAADGQRALWRELTDMGWAGTLLPDALGGLDWGWREAAILGKELGRTLTPVPFLSNALVAASGLRTLDDATAAATMSGIATGESQVAVAGLPLLRQPADSVVAVGGPDGDRLRGTCWFALDAAAANHLLVVADLDGTTVLARVEPREGVELVPHQLVDRSRSAATVVFRDTPATVIASGADAERALAAMETALTIGLACDALGGAERVLDETVEYARTRIQFGRPIGSFQAIKHKLADLYVLLQGTNAIVDKAVDYLADATDKVADPDAQVRSFASLAHAYAADAYARIAGDSILIYGAIGFTWEHNAHLYLKRALLNQQLAGPVADHRDRHLAQKITSIGGSR